MRLIVNGKAAGSPELRAAVGHMRDEGATIEVRVTWESGDAARYAQEALHDGVDVVIAAGGDGTINEVVSGLMQVSHEPSVAVGVIPFGTANDFANGCGIPIGDPLAALKLIVSTEPVAIDVARCNDRYFINVASGGFGAEVTTNTPADLKRAIGGAAYTLTGLVTAMKMTPYEARVITPDGQEEHGHLFVVAVGNGCQAGGGIRLAPDASLNDGLLDVLGIVDVEIRQLGSILGELANLTAPENQFVKYAQLAEFRIESKQPLQMNLDGEPLRDTVFQFSVLPAALKFVLPPDAPLTRKHDH